MSVSARPGPVASAPARQALPDPAERIPELSGPIVAIFAGALALFSVSSGLAIDHRLPRVLTIGLNALAIFVMFTVVHDASHYSISSRRWVNGVFGRAAMLFVSSAMAFPAFGFVHIEHHRHANDDDQDPDTFASHGSWWQLPFRWAAMDLAYVPFYARNLSRRPRAEVAETAGLMLLTVTVIVATLVTGGFWLLAVIYLIPERIAMIFLAWWFDWLPHHALEDTQRDNRYRATRIRVGMEWLLTPLMLSQNYHLVHHLHPSVPFHRYLATWRRNEGAYLERDAAIATVFGQPLEPAQFREWKKLNGKLRRVLPVRMPNASAATHATFHEVSVKSVDRLTPDSVEIAFDVPEALQRDFSFHAGQHIAVRTALDLFALDQPRATDRGEAHPRRGVLDVCIPAATRR
jgi:fatty acid desaturase